MGTSKKAQTNIGGVINGLVVATLGIIVLGLVLTYSSDIVQDERDDYVDSATFNSTNESVTFVAGAIQVGRVGGGGVHATGFVNGSSVDLQMTNGTNNSIGNTNYQWLGNGSIILTSGTSSDIGATANVNVSYNYVGDAFDAKVNASDSTLASINEISDRVDTLGTIIIVGAIITVLLSVFGGLLLRRYIRG